MNESNEETYYQRNRDVIVNTAKVYYENDKERLKDQVRDKYRNLSEEVYVAKDLFEILVIVSVNVINHVMLVNI